MTSKRTIKDYFDKGWLAFPIPAGEKFPPPPKVTGRWHNPTVEELWSVWESYGFDSNLALKLSSISDEFDIMGIDIDTYGEKDGWSTYEKLAENLGPLPLDKAPLCTRRGPESGSGQWYFLVPKGHHLNGDLGDFIDIIQTGHRYAVAYPSVIDKDGLQYEWYLNGEKAEIPNVNDLPLLPQAWLEVATNKRGGRRSAARAHIVTEGSDSARYRGALDWMREELWGFDVPWDESMVQEDYLSPQIAYMTESETLLERYTANSHDNMNSDVYRVIAFGTEGHKGVKAGLLRIFNAFREVNERRNGPTRRSEEVITAEYQRSVYEGVNKIAGEIEAGQRFLIGDPASYVIDTTAFSRAKEQPAYVRPVGIDLQEVKNDDYSHASEFAKYWGLEVRYIASGGSKPFATWTEGDRRYTLNRVDQMYSHVNKALCIRMEHEASKLIAQAESIEEAMETKQLPEDTPDPEDLRASARSIEDRVSKIRHTTQMRNILAQMASISSSSMKSNLLDREELVYGLPGGMTLDLRELDQGEIIRESRKEDMLTMEMSTSTSENFTTPAFERFLDKHLPDPEIRDFVQTVAGYCLEEGNPQKILPILWGPSNTGKTVFLEACSNALGAYGSSSSVGALLRTKDSGGPNPEILSAMSSLMVTLAEVGAGETIDGNALKKITGNDLITARQLYSGDMEARHPRFTPYLATNTVPKIKDADDATKRRLVVLPFTHEAEKGRTSHESDIIKNPENQRAVLWWLIEGYRRWREKGLAEDTWPKEVLELREEFISDTSPLHLFLGEVTVREEGAKVEKDILWKKWVSWNENQNITRANMGTKRDFESALRGNGYVTYRTSVPGKEGKVTCYRDLAMR